MKKIIEKLGVVVFVSALVLGCYFSISFLNKSNEEIVDNRQSTSTPEVIVKEKAVVEYEVLIKEAQEKARAEIEAKAQEAYNETYDLEMNKISAQVLAEYESKIKTLRSEKESAVDAYWRDRSSIKKLIQKKANEYGVSASTMRSIVDCESQYHVSIQSKHVYTETNVPKGYKVGDREQSFGLVQIHLPAHSSVSYKEAIDPEFAVDFLAKNLAVGNGWMWTC